MKSKAMTRGNIKATQSPKPMCMFKPSGSFNACRAMALGGVPIGVAIPPRLAAMGMESVSAVRPLPSGGKAANTGVRKTSIMAAVAVLLINMEKVPVIRMNPSRTVSERFPKGLISVLASSTSNPDLVAAMARINPPRNSMITGLANVAMISFELISVPNDSLSLFKNDRLLSDTVKHIVVMMTNEVAHDGMASVIHSRVASTKMAITRCCTVVSPSIPNDVLGRFQTISASSRITSDEMSFFISN